MEIVYFTALEADVAAFEVGFLFPVEVAQRAASLDDAADHADARDDVLGRLLVHDLLREVLDALTDLLV